MDAAQQLVLSKGYERMSIQDILDVVGMSSGAFHHYFDSRKALLEALIERIKLETDRPLLPIIHDPTRTAIEKMQGFFETFRRLRSASKSITAQLIHVWYTDDNAVVRLRVDEAVFRQRSPLLAEIVRQGIREGTFHAAYPENAGNVVLSLMHALDNADARCLLSLGQETDPLCAEQIVASHDAYMDAVERVLGVPSHALPRVSREEASGWVRAVREHGGIGAKRAERSSRPGRRL